MILQSILVLAAALAAAPKSEVRSVRIHPAKLTISRPKSTSETIVTGQFRVDMSFPRATAKKPVLRLVSVCEVDGELVMHNIFFDRQGTFEPMKRGDIMNAFKQAGIDIPFKEREKAYSDPAQFTPLLPEVSKEAYSVAQYGDFRLDRGFFRLGRCSALPKIVIFRLELWQNGAMAASWESSKTGLAKYGLPDDWHVWKKHPQKFKYVDVR